MAKTPFNAQLTCNVSGTPLNNYTVPAGKYAVFNTYQSGPNGAVFYINGSPLAACLFVGAYLPNLRIGPFAVNGGDVLTCITGTAGAWGLTNPASGPYGASINGMLFDTSNTRVPFTSILLANSATFTVPAGKYCVFNAYLHPLWGFGGLFMVLINSIPVFGGPNDPTNTAVGGITIMPQRFGPGMAKAGDVIRISNVYGSGGVMPGGDSVAKCIINGLLYNA